MRNKLLTTGQAAKKIGTDVQSIRRWTDRGLLHAIRHPTSNARLIDAADVDVLAEKLGELL
ncbi:MAG TPA: hypothetical protein DDW41_02065 [Candidatus Andersenbacteria bacterium]|nr:hypothetical protein [Candidatus Andersenbacteria bacterium]